MTDEEILAWAQRVYYARVDIDPDFCMHYGKEKWEERLPVLSQEQRAMLIERIEQWESAMSTPAH
jgi:hypothetical protein